MFPKQNIIEFYFRILSLIFQYIFTLTLLNIDLTTTANIERLTLFDVKGKLIYETVDFTNSNIQINMNKLSEGIYMLKVQSTNEVKNYKVLKQ